MNIGMILNGHFANDIRVKKEASALIRAGHHVYLLCLRKKEESYDDAWEGVKITRIDAGKNDYQLAFYDIMISLTSIHPKFKKKMTPWLTHNNIEVIHVHDLPLAGTALYFKKKYAIPVVVDFHENYPEALRAWFTWKANPIARLKNRMFMSPDRWTRLEKKAVDGADTIIAVVEEMKERIVADHQAPPEKIKVVTNTEDISFGDQPLDPTLYESLSGKFILTYSGGIGAHRGLDTAIRGMRLLQAYKDIHLAIIGSGSRDVIDRLKHLTTELDLSASVSFWGHQPFQKFYSIMYYADANVIPHISNGHTENTIPHKLFQGMMVGKPLLVSTCAPLKRIIEEAKAGVVFQAGNPEDFANKVLELYRNPDGRKQMGINGMAIVKSKYNWQETSRSLVATYDDLERQGKIKSELTINHSL